MTSLIVGRNAVVEALTQGKDIDKILLYREAHGEGIGDIRRLAKQQNIPIQHVPMEKLSALTKTQHQGVVAIGALIKYYNVQEVLDHVYSEGEIPLFIILDSVTDVRNVGAIARTALCCGAHAIIIPDSGGAALQEDAIKASAGALLQVMVCRVHSLAKTADELHLNGFQIVASIMQATANVFDINFTLPTAVIMGGEEKGIQPVLKKIADQLFKIPMLGEFNSLNVSVAMGMVLYEAMKQRMK